MGKASGRVGTVLCLSGNPPAESGLRWVVGLASGRRRQVGFLCIGKAVNDLGGIGMTKMRVIVATLTEVDTDAKTLVLKNFRSKTYSYDGKAKGLTTKRLAGMLNNPVSCVLSNDTVTKIELYR